MSEFGWEELDSSEEIIIQNAPMGVTLGFHPSFQKKSEIPIFLFFCSVIRWTTAAANLQNIYDNLMGDVLISSGVIAYLGAFTSAFRHRCTSEWTKLCTVGCQTLDSVINVLNKAGTNISGMVRGLLNVNRWGPDVFHPIMNIQ